MRFWPSKRPEQRADWGDTLVERYMIEAETAKSDISRLAVAEACAGVLGRCFTAARVDGTDLLTPDQLDIIGRSLILRGEYVALITADGYLAPASTADILGSSANPMEWIYRCQYNSPGGGSHAVVAPAESVLHVRTGASRAAPWRGRSPLLGAMSDVELTMAAARSLQGEASVKSHEYLAPPVDNPASRLSADQVSTLTDRIRRMSNGKTVVLSDPVAVTRTGPAPSATLDAARKTSSMEIAAAAGIPPVLLQAGGDGGAAREGYRRLTRATVEPLGRLLAHEATIKLGGPVTLDFKALRASDTAMAARAFAALAQHIPQDQALEISGLLEVD